MPGKSRGMLILKYTLLQPVVRLSATELGLRFGALLMLLGPTGVAWPLLGPTDVAWPLLGPTDVAWPLLGPTDVAWPLLGP